MATKEYQRQYRQTVNGKAIQMWKVVSLTTGKKYFLTLAS